MGTEGIPATRDVPASSAVAPSKSLVLELVYIVGAHKSGATVLGALLGMAPGVFYGGEIYRFPKPIFDPREADRKCSCGETVTTCPFWRSVRERAGRDPAFLSELRRGQREFERWGRLPATMLASARDAQDLRAHERRMGEFLGVLAAEDGARTVVESSYSALRAWLYGHEGASGVTARYLHLVRDGRGFLASELALDADPGEGRKWFRLPPIVVLRWSAFNALALLFALRGPRQYLRVRYEDLLERPEETLTRLERFLSCDLSEARQRVARGDPIPMRHIVAGNRLRLQGEFRLRKELAVPAPLPASVRAVFWTLAGPLARGLGYRLSPRSAPTGPAPTRPDAPP